MIEYTNKEICFEGNTVDTKGLNTSHILWHLQDITRPDLFLQNINESYTMPKYMNVITLVEGTDFDAVLIDDKLFKYSKINESDLEEVQSYINKHAYATALLKLNESANIIGCGLSKEYTTEEAYSYLSKSYDLLLENVYETKVKGKLVEGFGNQNKVNIYESEDLFLRGVNDKRYAEDWKNTFNYNDITKYELYNVKESNKLTEVSFVDPQGRILEAVFENTNSKLVESGINLKHFLKESNLVNSYRIGTLLEYQQPFTIKEAVILGYDIQDNKVVLQVQDIYGNRGTLDITLNISTDEFKDKYSQSLDDILEAKRFDERQDLTSFFLDDASECINSISRLKGRQIITSDTMENWNKLSYKVAGKTPDYSVISNDQDVVSINTKDKSKFFVKAFDKDGKKYNINYDYIEQDIPIQDFIDDINTRIEDGDFGEFDIQTDVTNFYKELNNYGLVKGSYPIGISTAGRKKKQEEGDIVESEGVQTTDIAPKLDQGSLIKVNMKKKKVQEDIEVNVDDLLINSLNEQDEYYGSRGFIKDEKGRYHFGDYYINESGKVVHKSKLVENQKQADDFYYKCNEINLVLNGLKKLTKDEEVIKKIEELYTPVNDLQLLGYDRLKKSNSESVNS